MNAGTRVFHCDVRLDQGAVRDFLAPQYVLNGDGAAKKTGDALRAWGVGPGRALVICDRFLFDSGALAELLDRQWPGPIPYTLLIAPGGKVIYRAVNQIDPLEVRRTIANHLGRTYASRIEPSSRRGE